MTLNQQKHRIFNVLSLRNSEKSSFLQIFTLLR